jgi:hypothetical protein
LIAPALRKFFGKNANLFRVSASEGPK